ncbi:hypothetical protein [Deinococcus sp.]|uniref:hypothetical protein n=1 Tax=Deinococcus sp. TaxID=47478 RepID=UPI002869C644|nr:hypothetical protein [Deinococcus sp.]
MHHARDTPSTHFCRAGLPPCLPRRGFHATAPTRLTTLLALTGAAGVQKTIDVGLQAGGILSWVTFAIQRYGLEKQLGFTLNATT